MGVTSHPFHPDHFILNCSININVLHVRNIYVGILQYKATDVIVPGPGKMELVYTPLDGDEPTRYTINNFHGAGVCMGMFNTDEVRTYAPFTITKLMQIL